MDADIPRPDADEYPPIYAAYVAVLAPYRGPREAFEKQHPRIERLQRLAPEHARRRYAPGRWTVADVIGHMVDAERVYGYRLLAIARGDHSDLPNFDEAAYAAVAGAAARAPVDLASELLATRQATSWLVRSLDGDGLGRRGVVCGRSVTARAMAWVVAGHLEHHLAVLRDRYQL